MLEQNFYIWLPQQFPMFWAKKKIDFDDLSQ